MEDQMVMDDDGDDDDDSGGGRKEIGLYDPEGDKSRTPGSFNRGLTSLRDNPHLNYDKVALAHAKGPPAAAFKSRSLGFATEVDLYPVGLGDGHVLQPPRASPDALPVPIALDMFLLDEKEGWGQWLAGQAHGAEDEEDRAKAANLLNERAFHMGVLASRLGTESRRPEDFIDVLLDPYTSHELRRLQLGGELPAMTAVLDQHGPMGLTSDEAQAHLARGWAELVPSHVLAAVPRFQRLR